MNTTLTLLGMALVTYLPRLLGFAFSNVRLAPFWLRFLQFVPVSVFAALIAPSLTGEAGEGDVRLLAALLASIIIWRSKSLALGLLTGMAFFWTLRLI